MHISDEELARRIEAARAEVDQAATYSHYRHPDSRYRIISIALLETTEQPAIIYQNLGNPKLVWIRPIEDWLAMVDSGEGQLVPRFRKVSQ